MTSSIPSVDAAKARLLANIADLHDLRQLAFSAAEREIYDQALAQAVADLADLNDREQLGDGPKQQPPRRVRGKPRNEEEKEEETADFYDYDDMILVSYNYSPPGEAPDATPANSGSDDDEDGSNSENDSHDLSSTTSPLPPPASASRDGALVVGGEQAAL
jgi:hypothetical protein